MKNEKIKIYNIMVKAITIIPMIATFLSGIGILPELLAVIKTWDATDLDTIWLTFSYIANCLWILYGYLQKDNNIILLGIIFALFYGFLITVKIMVHMGILIPLNN